MSRQIVLILSFFAFAASAMAQTTPLTCTANAGVPPIVRVEGYTEMVGDLILICTGGTPTPQGQPVPLVNITMTLTTNLTSRLLSLNYFSEALLIIDEPNSPLYPSRPLLNCGAAGAPDNGPFGPGVCAIISTSYFHETYDGTPDGLPDSDDADSVNDICGETGYGFIIPANTYGCGRPNVFQGRRGTLQDPSATNAVSFVGVPFDPPGDGEFRILRITNVRADAELLGVSGTFNTTPIVANVSISGQIEVPVNNPSQTVAFIMRGHQDLLVTAPTPATGGAEVTLTAREGFANAWKVKNFSFGTGDSTGTPGNATYNEPGLYPTYNGGTNYPLDIAQNVPGAIYNTESGFEWMNNAPNGPPSPNPPEGIGTIPVLSYGGPLHSAGLGAWPTNIHRAGVADAGTRVAIQFTDVPAGVTLSVPPVIEIKRAGTTTVLGVAVLIQTDSHGLGAYQPVGAPGLSAPNLAVYELLWTDPFWQEVILIPVTVTYGGGAPTSIKAGLTYAPFFSPGPEMRKPQPILVPRFIPPSKTVALFPNP